jgi:hypothetical protein
MAPTCPGPPPRTALSGRMTLPTDSSNVMERSSTESKGSSLPSFAKTFENILLSHFQAKIVIKISKSQFFFFAIANSPSPDIFSCYTIFG